MAVEKGPHRRRSSRLWTQLWSGGAVLLLWVLFAQALTAARAASITFDEGPHLAVGYTTLRTGDLRLQPVHIHPPLANLLAAAPVALNSDLPDPRTVEGWDIASLSAITDSLVWKYPHPARLALAGRLPIILLTLLTGALVWRWAADLGGAGAGLVALALYTFDPNVIAHGSLITTDMAVTAFGLSTFFLLHRYFRRPTHPVLIGAGGALGLALSSKVSAVLMLAVIAGLFLIRGRGRGRTWGGAAAVPLAVIGGVAFFLLWGVYGFEWRAVPDLAGSVPIPAATHLEIYRSLREHYRLGHPAFLHGEISNQGWWYYFPLAFLVKTPLPVLVLGGGTLFLLMRRRRPIYLTLTLFPTVYAVTALFSSVDIGYRHLLPVLPFLYVVIGYVLNPLHPLWSVQTLLAGRRQRFIYWAIPVVLSGLFLWLVAGTLLILPFPLTFFNELAGRAEGGYRWLVDSNLDWGQSLRQLRDWTQAKRVESVYYSHYSPARPEVYGLKVDWLPPDPRAVPFAPFDPAPGVYAIGATTLQGVYTPDVNTFAFFRTRRPETVLGHALFLYRVPPHPAPDWVGVCFGVPLGEEQLRAGFGQPDLRLVSFDCRTSWIYPANGEARFVVPPQVQWLNGLSPLLRARQADGRPAYAILRMANRPVPDRGVERTDIDGPLTFLGYRIDRDQVRPGNAIILETFWQVEEVPNRSLSLMAHMVGDDGVPVAVGDGLGVPIEGWRPQDIIIQRHRLSVPPDVLVGDYGLQTGAYWLDTMTRWPVRDGAGNVTEQIELTAVRVRD